VAHLEILSRDEVCAGHGGEGRGRERQTGRVMGGGILSSTFFLEFPLYFLSSPLTF